MITIVPIARAENVERVCKLHALQTCPSELVLAPSPGVWAGRAQEISFTMLPPTMTIGGARNVALEYARSRRHEWAVFWDDDNYYGPYYSEQIAAQAHSGVDVLSAGIAFVRHDSGLWLYPQSLRFFPGHSTAVRVRAAARFPEWSLSEDVEWSIRMRARGCRAELLPPWGLVYDRRAPAGHAYQAAESIFLRAHGPARGPFDRLDTATDVPWDWSGPLVRARDEDVFAAMGAR